MKNIQREDIHIIGRYSNLTEQDIDKILKENVYNNREGWLKFLKLFFIALGIGFSVSGIVFFFAYNWADLHKFAKIGLTEGLIIATTCFALFLNVNTSLKNIILTGAAVLVGVLFAVFGQIYQTGANAYDFFLAWTIFVTLWVVVSNFAPLWLLYLVLINTTFILYTQQVVGDWSTSFVFTILSIFNTAALITSILFARYKKINIPNWFSNVVALFSISCATIGIVVGIFDQIDFPVLFLIMLLFFALGIWYGLTAKSVFYIALIPFCLIIIVSALMIRHTTEIITFLLISLFVIISVTGLIIGLINIQKKWKNEE